MNTKTTAKDFFLHIAAIGLLYAGTVAVLNILFRVINAAFPQVDQYSYLGSSSISFPVATLIVVFPLFLFLANVLRKSYAEDPSKKDYSVRKWLIYITLFVAAAVLAGDLVTLIYFFLDGRELTVAFLLKIAAVLLVAGAIFGYYLDDLKDRLSDAKRNLWRVAAAVIVIGSIVAGFSVLGSPQSQRMLRYDDQKISDLQSIQWQLINYWQQKGSIPENLESLRDPISGYSLPLDPQSKASYEYKKMGAMSFELCAEFNRESTKDSMSRVAYMEPMGKTPENWQHSAGRNCFSRTIDPGLYPVRPK